MRIRGSGVVPAALRDRLDAHERVLSVADLADSVIVATQLGLWLPEPDAAGSPWRRIGWECVVKATWTETGLQVVEGVSDENGVVGDLPEVGLNLTAPRNLPSVVKQRVENSIARWEQVRVPDGTARLVARRVPGKDGLRWTARLDTGTPDTMQARQILVTYLRQITSAEEQTQPS
jgi:hypothetical protein